MAVRETKMTKKAMLLSFLGGFLSLSIEVIWMLDVPPANSSWPKVRVWSCATASGMPALRYSGAAADS